QRQTFPPGEGLHRSQPHDSVGSACPIRESRVAGRGPSQAPSPMPRASITLPARPGVRYVPRAVVLTTAEEVHVRILGRFNHIRLVAALALLPVVATGCLVAAAGAGA